jgi:hypothetical protein
MALMDRLRGSEQYHPIYRNYRTTRFHFWQRGHHERRVTNGKHAFQLLKFAIPTKQKDVCCSFKVSAYISSKPEQVRVHHEGALSTTTSGEIGVKFF